MQLSDPFCLSTTGSTRATAYNWSNKCVTRDGRTYVVWLDAVATICGREYDHRSGAWGQTVAIDTGADNHANPSLTMDAAGVLRLTYGPHGWSGEWNQGRVRWRQADRPPWCECSGSAARAIVLAWQWRPTPPRPRS